MKILKKRKRNYKKKVSKIINGKKWFGDLILYDDSSSVWKPWSKDEINQSRALLKIKSDTMKIFNEYWSTTRLFPYKKKNLENLKDTIFIDLEASGKFFCSPSNKVTLHLDGGTEDNIKELIHMVERRYLKICI